MKKISVLFICAVMVLGLYRLANDPVIVCKYDLPEEMMEAVESQAEGLYSKSLPLIPIYAEITQFENDTVYYTIYYFPFGTVGMSYKKYDGYNIEKSLTRF